MSPESPQTYSPGMQVYLRSSDQEEPDHPPNLLVRALGLAVYGRSLLTRRGEIEMTTVGLVLIMIFLFDWMAWSLLFNAILNPEILDLTLRTGFALFAGALFGAVVMVYERQFVTSDTSTGLRQQRLPMAIRLAVILASALITAQPVHLLFFREPIQQRVHEEGIRLHVGAILEQLQTTSKERTVAEKDLQGTSELASCLEAASLQSEIRELYDEQIDIQVAFDSAVQNRNYWRNQVSALRRQVENYQPEVSNTTAPPLTDPGLTQLRRSLEEAERSLRYAQNRVGSLDQDRRRGALQLESKQGQHQENSETCRSEMEQIEDDVDQRLTEIEIREQSLRSWIQDLQSLAPSEADSRSTQIAGHTFTYRLPKYDFFAQLGVLEDLQLGAGPAWKGSSGSDIERAAAAFGLVYPRDCDAASARAPCSAEERSSWQRVQARAWHFRWAHLGVYGIAIVIPTLVIALKLLLPVDLISYYAPQRQARAGNPEAIRLLATLTEEQT